MDPQNDTLSKILTKLEDVSTQQKNTDSMFDTILAKVVSIAGDIEAKMVTKDDVRETESRLLGHIDGFIKLPETLDTELVAMRSKYDRLEERLGRVEQKVGIVV